MINKNIPTILGVIFITMGIITGVLLIQKTQILRIRAEQTTSPKNIRVSNITDSSFTVSWTTDGDAYGFIKWKGNSRFGNSERVAEPESKDDLKTHSITISNLENNSEYLFIINSNGKDFDNNGVDWQVRTGPKLVSTTTTYTISGKVVDKDHNPINNAIVYAVVGGGSLISTTTSANGNWILTVTNARNQNLTSYISVDPQSTPIEIIVYTDSANYASTTTYLASSTQFEIVMDDSNNFSSSQNIDSLPSASIKLPENQDQSGFGDLIK